MTKEERLMQIELEYMERFERGDAPSLEELVEIYPDMREELVEFVLDYVSMETEVAEPSEEALQAAAAARENILEKILKEPESLAEARKASGQRLGTLAAAVNVPKDTLHALEKGTILADSVPEKLLGRLSEALDVAQKRVYSLIGGLAVQSIADHSRARKLPQEEGGQITFTEALRDNPERSEGQREDWLMDETSKES